MQVSGRRQPEFPPRSASAVPARRQRPGNAPDLLELIQARGRAVTEAMRQLVTEVQADGEAARDDGLIDRVNEYAAMPPLPALG
jgi:hypothetical protein